MGALSNRCCKLVNLGAVKMRLHKFTRCQFGPARPPCALPFAAISPLPHRRPAQPPARRWSNPGGEPYRHAGTVQMSLSSLNFDTAQQLIGGVVTSASDASTVSAESLPVWAAATSRCRAERGPGPLFPDAKLPSPVVRACSVHAPRLWHWQLRGFSTIGARLASATTHPPRALGGSVRRHARLRSAAPLPAGSKM